MHRDGSIFMPKGIAKQRLLTFEASRLTLFKSHLVFWKRFFIRYFTSQPFHHKGFKCLIHCTKKAIWPVWTSLINELISVWANLFPLLWIRSLTATYWKICELLVSRCCTAFGSIPYSPAACPSRHNACSLGELNILAPKVFFSHLNSFSMFWLLMLWRQFLTVLRFLCAWGFGLRSTYFHLNKSVIFFCIDRLLLF